MGSEALQPISGSAALPRQIRTLGEAPEPERVCINLSTFGATEPLQPAGLLCGCEELPPAVMRRQRTSTFTI